MTFTTPAKTFKTLRQDDPDFHMDNGIAVFPRAAIEISNKCPGQYKLMITEAVKHGWVQPVAYMLDSEYVWEKLNER